MKLKIFVPSASVRLKTATDLKHFADHAKLSSVTQPCVIMRDSLLFLLVKIEINLETSNHG